MRNGSFVIAAVILAAPVSALAHPTHGDGGSGSGTTTDHRSSGGGDTHDHRSGGGGSASGETHEHRGGGTYYDDGPAYFAEDSGGGSCVGDCGSSIVLPAMQFEIGGLGARFRGPAFTRYGSIPGGDGAGHDYMLTGGTPSERDTAAGALDLRATVSASPHLYLGAELELGGLTRSPIALMTDQPDARISTSMIGVAAVSGVRARAGAFEIDGELAGGVRAMTTSITQSYNGPDASADSTETAAQALVEARVRGALWISPRWFVAGQVGTSLLDQNDQSFAIMIGSATRPYAEP